MFGITAVFILLIEVQKSKNDIGIVLLEESTGIKNMHILPHKGVIFASNSWKLQHPGLKHFPEIGRHAPRTTIKRTSP